jgi:hypothetical protein
MNQALYAHMNNKRKMKKKRKEIYDLTHVGCLKKKKKSERGIWSTLFSF